MLAGISFQATDIQFIRSCLLGDLIFPDGVSYLSALNQVFHCRRSATLNGLLIETSSG
jgi:hypothetical protein